MVKKYWLFKSEPTDFSIDDLQNSLGKKTYWDGIRNYQARNFIRDDMRKGDSVLFYHSNSEPLAVVGYCEIVKEAYPDYTQFDPDKDPGKRWSEIKARLVKEPYFILP